MIRRPLMVLLTLLAITAAGCTPAADKTVADAPAVTAADPAPEAAPAEEPKAPATRPLDEGAMRALAEEVARLRAELEIVHADRAAARDVAAQSDDHDEADAALPRVEADTPLVVPVDGSEVPDGADTSDEGTFTGFSPEPPVVDRGLAASRYIDDEPYTGGGAAPALPADGGRRTEVVYEDSEPEVVYEQVVYEDVITYQYVPVRHSHHIGCGHHYYGCTCHPWYYTLGGSLSYHLSHYDYDLWFGYGHGYRRSYGHYGFGYYGAYASFHYYDRGSHHGHHGHRGHHADDRRVHNKIRRNNYRRGYRDGFADGSATLPARPLEGGTAASRTRSRNGANPVSSRTTRPGRETSISSRGAQISGAARVRPTTSGRAGPERTGATLPNRRGPAAGARTATNPTDGAAVRRPTAPRVGRGGAVDSVNARTRTNVGTTTNEGAARTPRVSARDSSRTSTPRVAPANPRLRDSSGTRVTNPVRTRTTTNRATTNRATTPRVSQPRVAQPRVAPRRDVRARNSADRATPSTRRTGSSTGRSDASRARTRPSVNRQSSNSTRTTAPPTQRRVERPTPRRVERTARPEVRRAPQQQTRRAPQQTRRAPQQTRRAPQQTRRAPQQTRRAPQQTRRAPQQTRRAPQQQTRRAPQRAPSRARSPSRSSGRSARRRNRGDQ